MTFISSSLFPDDICMDVEPEEMEHKEEQWVLLLSVPAVELFLLGFKPTTFQLSVEIF